MEYAASCWPVPPAEETSAKVLLQVRGGSKVETDGGTTRQLETPATGVESGLKLRATLENVEHLLMNLEVQENLNIRNISCHSIGDSPA